MIQYAEGIQSFEVEENPCLDDRGHTEVFAAATADDDA